MKENRSENNETMSTGELLGKLKQNFAEGETAVPARETADRAKNAPSDADLDIAALLKQYLPETDEPTPAKADRRASGNAAEDELPSDEAALNDDVTVETEVPAPKSGAHFASLLDTLEEDFDQPVSDAGYAEDDLPADPMGDFAIAPEPAPAPEVPAAPPSVRKSVYRFRPAARNNPVQTVKVRETVPQEMPAHKETPAEDTYFAGRLKTDFALDDEPVIPDESAFIDLLSSVEEESGEPAFTPDFAEGITAEAEPTEPEQIDAEPEAVETDPKESKSEAPDLDGTDINLLIALGYEEELTKTVGIDKVNEIEKQLDSELRDEDTRESAAFRGFEYTEKSQAKEIMQNYKSEHSGMMMRLFGTLVMLVALFLYENVSLFGVELPGALNMQQYPAVHTLISLQLLVLCGALSWRQLLDGIKGAFTLKPTPQSLVAVAVAVAVVYDLIVALVAPQDGVSLYNFPAALCLALLVLCDLMNLKREICSFTILADRREKFAVRPQLNQEAQTEEESLTLDIRRAAFIDQYFARTNRKPAANSRLNYVLLPVVALAIALAIVAFSTTKSGIDAMNIFVLTVLFCMPVSTLIACSYPLFRASQIAYEQDTAIIGETSAEEYSGADLISFADKDVFPSYSVKLRSIKLYGNARPDLVLLAATSVFSKVGGPLADVLELATMEFDRAEKVELLRIAENGIEAKVDGGSVLVGRSEFLEDYNIYPLHDAEDDANTIGGGRILYIVMDGALSAKLYIQYDMDVDFEFTLRELAREEIAAKIRTYDPNIDDDLLFSKLRGKQYNVHVEKQLEEPSEPDLFDRLDSGLVSRSSAKSLVHTAVMCSRLTHVERTGGIIRAVALGVSLLIMLFLTLLSSSVGISSVYVALYQIFWMIPALIITHLFIK